ncbi:hypothetical protein JPM2_2410 [Mycoplasmopsis felis]|uniref:Transposase IS4-like domain-containing protein n=2 Tax=Mycoplasmopsis felis TaxID=33923 RepID=A0A809SEP2_9BACT|nr:hypothetical protein JPM2_2410 [Mycoplasmopsis felis]
MGMACDINGIPIFYKVFPGNTADVKTLIPFFNEFKQLFPEKRIIVVAVRGMSSAENIKFLERNQIDFLISYRSKVASKNIKNICWMKLTMLFLMMIISIKKDKC